MKTLLFTLAVATMLCFAQDKWQMAESAITRLSPTTFPQLPGDVMHNLQARGCTVPQTYLEATPHNVISGEFAKKGQTDWAVLCSRDGASSILVFWSGSTKSVSEVAKVEDRSYLQVTGGNGKISFSRSIIAVGGGYILERYRRYGGPKPPHIDHQGIDDGFLGKASSVWYYHRGRWLELQGAD